MTPSRAQPASSKQSNFQIFSSILVSGRHHNMPNKVNMVGGYHLDEMLH